MVGIRRFKRLIFFPQRDGHSEADLSAERWKEPPHPRIVSPLFHGGRDAAVSHWRTTHTRQVGRLCQSALGPLGSVCVTHTPRVVAPFPGRKRRRRSHFSISLCTCVRVQINEPGRPNQPRRSALKCVCVCVKAGHVDMGWGSGSRCSFPTVVMSNGVAERGGTASETQRQRKQN